MEIYLMFVLIILGSLSAMFSSIITYLTIEDLNKLVEKSKISSIKLQNIKLHFEETANAFIILEGFCYLVAVSVLSYYLSNNSIISRIYSEYYYLLLSVFILSIIIIILRTVFTALGRRIAPIVALPLTPVFTFIIFIGKPAIFIVDNIQKKISGKEIEEASREEINAMFETAHEEGSIETGEYRILKNIMHFSEVIVSDVMTPRTVIFGFHAERTVGEILDKIELQMYSRFPIWEGKSLDDGIVGYIMTKDILNAALKGQKDVQLRDFAREVYIIPENAELDNALDTFLKRRQHLFLVVDEYGGVAGLLTMEDVLETILGVEIIDEADKIVDMREAAKQHRDKRIAGLLNQI